MSVSTAGPVSANTAAHPVPRRGALEHRERWLFRAMLAPGMLISAAVIFLPVLYAISLSFYHAESFISPFSFVGLANYARILGEARFWAALLHGVFYAVTTVALQLVIGIAIATVLHKQFAGRDVLRGVALLPYVLPTVSAAFIWKWILDPNNGLTASLLTDAGFGVVDWFGDGTTAWISLIFISVWQWTPFVTVTYLAGLQGVPAELYEAAYLDGATAWQCFTRITLPALKPVLVVIVLLRGIFMFNKFDMIWLLTAGGPLNATENLAVLAYQKTFDTFDIGGGAATACSIFLMLTAVIWVVFRVVKLEDA
jgi:multiple sugar transport system permease protein